jgi:hypothetical protein
MTMDAKGNIYRAPEDEIPAEDRRRFDQAVLAGEARRAQIAPDGYYRPVAEAVLTAATEAQLRDWVEIVDRELDANLAEDFTRGRTVPDTLVGHVVHGLVGEDTLDAALGEGRR